MGQSNHVTVGDVALGAVLSFFTAVFVITALVGLILVIVTAKVLTISLLGLVFTDPEPVASLLAFGATLGACLLIIPSGESSG